GVRSPCTCRCRRRRRPALGRSDAPRSRPLASRLQRSRQQRRRGMDDGNGTSRTAGRAQGASHTAGRAQGASQIETMQVEERRFAPSAEFSRQANAQPDIYNVGFDEFWTKASERVSWFEPWEQLFEWKPPYAKWFIGGKLNVCYNCVDRHVEGGRSDKVAFFWEGEPEDERRAITFGDLQHEVVRFANGLKKLGIKKGTHVGIYMGMIPELPVAMLACTRIGAPFTVVFGGFSGESLSGRLNDMACTFLITQDEGWRRGHRVPLKAN